MGKIIAVGGGDMREAETLPIDQEVVELTGKARPKALFIPTASYDSVEYWEGFQRIYGGQLGCETAVLYLLKLTPSRAELEESILSADLIYVGGGNTLKMMRRWRKLGVDRLLEQAYNRDTVLAGVSAGAICWFSYGHSDSMAFYHPGDWSYIRVKGMGLIDSLACPHFDGETGGVKRKQDFLQMVQRHRAIGVGIDNHGAIVFAEGGFRVIACRPGAGAYQVYMDGHRAAVREIAQVQEFRPVSTLLQI